MKKYLLFLLMLLTLVFVGCGKKNGGYEPAAIDGFGRRISGEYYSKAEASMEEPTGVILPDEGEVDIPEEENQELPQSGQLTSSVVFDNDHYDFWKSLITKGQEEGLLYRYRDTYKFDTTNRIKINTNGLVGAKVIIDNKYSGQTDSNGIVYLFPKEKDSYQLEITYKDVNGKTVTIKETITGDYEFTPEEASIKKNLLQIAFVIDTTGSMGDEIRYLQSEITNVISRVKEDNANIDIELALVFYRDHGDDYVTKTSDFSKDIDKQKKELEKQRADGGGDWEEAVQEGFKKANKLSWKEEAKTKLLIWVADAPCHAKDVDDVIDEVNEFAKNGIRVITVASSGIDKGTEFLFRSICLQTNGCYGYLTNDSGIGGDHVEATTEEKPTVEYLNNMLVRLINGFYSGEFSEAIPWRGQDYKPEEK